jgi:hypothetical protein
MYDLKYSTERDETEGRETAGLPERKRRLQCSSSTLPTFTRRHTS